MFRIAHLTDPHVGPLPRPRLRELLSKRLTGYINWRRGRDKFHDMELLAALVTDLHDQDPDHIACTGDVSNIGLPDEWTTAKLFLDSLGSPDRVSFVPGNHDAYIDGALEGLLAVCSDFTSDDTGLQGHFPYVRRRGAVALIGLSSAIPTAPFVASGRMGRRQMADTREVLAELGAAGLCRVVMIHHPPHVAGATAGRNLTDARAFEAMVGEMGAELVLHGHNHIGSVATIMGPRHPVPVIGAPSASSRGGTITHRAGYHLFDITGEPGDWRIAAQLRGLLADGSIGLIEELSLVPERLPLRESLARHRSRAKVRTPR